MKIIIIIIGFYFEMTLIFNILCKIYIRDSQNLDVVMFLKLRSLILTSTDLTCESLFKILD